MIDLDDKQALLKLQGGDTVLKSVDELPDQLLQAFKESQQLAFPNDFKTIKNIVVCGMGGSRFTPLIIKELFKKKLKVPYVINDDYNLPGFVNSDTLVILSSYSGTTEEVLINGKAALAKRVKITGVTEGGPLASFLLTNQLPVYVFDPVHNPSKQPRIGLGYMVAGHLGILMNLGLIDIDKKTVETALNNLPLLLSNFKVEVPKAKNPAKQLAAKLYSKYPYYIVSEFLTGVGNGIGNQTNETAKSISSFSVIPELNHHLMEGLKFPEELHKIAMFVFFYSQLYSSSIQKRFNITKEVVEKNNIATHWHQLSGKSEIEQVFELMGLGTYMTMYLSALYRQDPTAIPYVDYFKAKLKET